MKKNTLLLIFLLLLSSIKFSYASVNQFRGFNNPGCNQVAIGWKDRKNQAAAGYEFCVRQVKNQVVNLTQNSIFVSNKNGEIFEVDAGSIFKRLPLRNFVHIVSQVDVRIYIVSGKAIVSPYKTAKETRNVYNSLYRNLPDSKINKVSAFRVANIDFENPIFNGSASQRYKDAQARAWPVFVTVGIAGGITGAINAYDPNNVCGRDIVRGAIIGAISGVGASLVALPMGTGYIVGATAGAAINKSLGGACVACHTNTGSRCMP